MNSPTHHDDPQHDDGSLPPSDEVRAGEYVLGVLDAHERRAVQARLASDTAFATLVESWELRLAPWLQQVQSVPTSAQLWPRIRYELGWSPVRNVAPPLGNNAAFRRGATAAALAAGVAAVVIGVRLLPADAPPPVTVVEAPMSQPPNAKPVTVLARDNGSTGWLASIDLAAGSLQVLPVPGPGDSEGRVPELWIIAADHPPVSLGAVSDRSASTVNVPTALRKAFAVGATLAVTLEQEAGIPHAAPSGPIVAKGNILSL